MAKPTLGKLEGLRKLYRLITEGKLGDEQIQKRVNIVRYLERETGQNFRSTDDFKKKMECYFIGQGKMQGADLRKIRKEKGWGQKTLADYLKISRVYLAQMESGRKPLNRGAVNFLYETHAQLLET